MPETVGDNTSGRLANGQAGFRFGYRVSGSGIRMSLQGSESIDRVKLRVDLMFSKFVNFQKDPRSVNCEQCTVYSNGAQLPVPVTSLPACPFA